MKIYQKMLIIALIASLSIVTSSVTVLTYAHTQNVDRTGPWADELYFNIFLDPAEEYLALKNGTIDIMDWELSAEKVADALADPNILTDSTADLGYYLIDINNQRWPTSNVHFRRALAHLVDKARIETEALQGFGYALDSPVPVVLGGWANPDIKTYEFSSELAAAELDLGGFTDTDADNIRNDPITGENMAPVIFYIRNDDPWRKQAGEWLAAELLALGVPVEGELAVERSVCSQFVMLDPAGEWNVYTGGWGLTRDPTHLSDFYHSREFDPDCIGGWRGYNYPGFVNSTYDYWADILRSASTFEEAKEAAFKCQEIIAEQVPGIPLFGHMGVKAYSAEWTGLVNQVGQGINSWWSFYNMHPANQDSGGTINYGIRSDIETLNPLTAGWTYTWEVLDNIYERIFKVNPYNLSEDLPWLAESWTIEDWTSDSGVDGIKVTFHFVQNASWHDGVHFTAYDVKFTFDFIQEWAMPRYLPSVQFVENVTVVDDYTVEIYQNTTSYFAFHYLNDIPILPRHIWESVGDGWSGYDPVAEDTLIGLGPWKFVENVSGEYVRLVDNHEYFKYPESRALEEWNVSLSVDVGGYDSTTNFGMVDGATEGFDEDAGDELVSPAPPTGVTSYFYYPDNPTGYVDYRKLSTSNYAVEYPAQWTLYAKTIGVSGEAVLTWASWDISRIPRDYFVSLETPTGSVNMREVTSYTWTAEADTTYIFNVTLTNEVEHTMNLKAGWNMVSLPVMPEDVSAAAVLSEVGFYQLVTWSGTGYVSATSFEEGRGYWLLVLGDVNVTVIGTTVDDVTLTLSPGWSMIGGPNSLVQASEVFPGFYQLVMWTGTGYASASEFESGLGYWALVLEETQIQLPSTTTQIINGGFEEEIIHDPWTIPGWEAQGATGWTSSGYSGKGLELYHVGTYSTYLSQNVYFSEKEGTLSFWIKPFPLGLNVSIQCLLDGIVVFNEGYYGPDDDFTWINVVIDFDTTIGTHEIRFIIPADWDAGMEWETMPSVIIDEVTVTH